MSSSPQLEDDLPAEHRLSGGCIYEMKFDGYRLVILKAAEAVHLWSRNGHDLTDRFPDIAGAATDQITGDAIIDGEVVAYDADRLSFDLLQRRLATRPSGVPALARQHPASFVAFDILSRDDLDLRSRPGLSAELTSRIWLAAGSHHSSCFPSTATATRRSAGASTIGLSVSKAASRWAGSS